jgi:hypothetical protein
VLDRHQQAVGFDELREDFLQDVFRVARVGHSPADETEQPGLLPGDHVNDRVVRVLAHLLLE